MSEAIARALGGTAEHASRARGPEGALVCVWRRPVQELHLAPMRGYTLAVHTGGSRVVRCWTGRGWSAEASRPGLLTLIPPRLPTSWLVDGSMDAITVSLPVSQLEATADEALSQRTTDLPLELAFRDPFVSTLAVSLAEELIEPRTDTNLFVERAHDLLAFHLLTRRHRRRAARRGPGTLPARVFRRVIEFMAASLESGVSLDELARIAGLSRFHFARAFKRTAGIAPHEFLTRQRVERARELLALTDLPLAEIALRLGFSSQSHFTSTFGRIAGAPPGAYRRSARWAEGPRRREPR